MNKKQYSILKQNEFSFEEKKSIFICNICPVIDENDALKFINKIKEQYSDATHNVYAYIVNDGISMRYSDDGEPHGTAGSPVLEVLKREDLYDVVAVVTRYFGGILLGAGGLIRAYSSACTKCLEISEKVLREDGTKATICFEYNLYGKINNYLKQTNVLIIKCEFLYDIQITFYCLSYNYDSIYSDIINITNGNNIFVNVEKEICFVDSNNKILEVK